MRLEALAPERDALWKRLEGTSFLTTDEKRALAGYGPQTDVGDRKFNPHHDDLGRFTHGPDGSGLVHDASRRRPGPSGTPAQEARYEAAAAQARDAVRRLQELDPTWRRPESATNPTSIEGAIAHQEAVARAAEARLSEILHDAIPGTNPTWGVNRLTKELYDMGYRLESPARRSPGALYRNSTTGETVRLMERQPHRWGTDPPEKHYFKYYYRYRGRNWPDEGRHTPVPDKN